MKDYLRRAGIGSQCVISFQGDKIMLFYTKFVHALAFIFVAACVHMRYLYPPVTFQPYLGLDKGTEYRINHHYYWVFYWHGSFARDASHLSRGDRI